MRVFATIALLGTSAFALLSSPAIAAPAPQDGAALSADSGEQAALDPQNAKQKKLKAAKLATLQAKKAAERLAPKPIKAWSQAATISDTASGEDFRAAYKSVQESGTTRTSGPSERITYAAPAPARAPRTASGVDLPAATVGTVSLQGGMTPQRVDGRKLPGIVAKAFRPKRRQGSASGLPMVQIAAGASALLIFMMLREYLAFTRRKKIVPTRKAARAYA